jgi:hypothetical protein
MDEENFPKQTSREVAAKLCGVNPHYFTDVLFITKQAPALAAQCREGKVTIQQALRRLGRLTPRDRQRQRAALVIVLCDAVIEGDFTAAKMFAEALKSGSGKWQWLFPKV